MKELEFYLDGKENGLVVLNKDGDILSLGRYHQVLFKNIDLLKATTEREKVFDYDVAIILNYKKFTKFDFVYKNIDLEAEISTIFQEYEKILSTSDYSYDVLRLKNA